MRRITLLACLALLLVAPQAAAQRFDDKGDTITDTDTGLMWEKKAGGPGTLHDPAATRAWDDDGGTDGLWTWLAEVKTENGTGLAGHSDWRIPSMKELATLLPVSGEAPPAGLPQTGNYWTSTQQFWYVGNTSTEPQFAMCIDFGPQVVHDVAPCCWAPQCSGPPHAYAIAVRDVPCALAQSGIRNSFGDDRASTLLGSRFDFEIRSDGTIMDWRSGLMWEKKTRSSMNPDTHDVDTQMTAAQADAWALGLEFAGYSDWRLPTPMELLGLVDNSQPHSFGSMENVSIAPAFNLNCKAADECDLDDVSCSCTRGALEGDDTYWSSHELGDGHYTVRHWDAWSQFTPSSQSQFARAVREAAPPQGPGCDDDALADSDDPCLFYPNPLPLADVNADGIPDECQCGDANGNNTIDNNDLTTIYGCLTGGIPPATCDANLAGGKAEANNNLVFDTNDLTRIYGALTGALQNYQLTCANRLEGTPPP